MNSSNILKDIRSPSIAWSLVQTEIRSSVLARTVSAYGMSIRVNTSKKFKFLRSAQLSVQTERHARLQVKQVYLYGMLILSNTLKSLTRNIGSEDKFRGKDIGSIGSVAFSPDGNTIVSCGGNNIHLWDSGTNQFLETLIGHTESVNSVVFSPDGETIVSVSDDGTIRLWNVNTRKPLKTLMAHADSVNSVVFSSDGETIASAGNDRTVRLWNANTGKLLRTLTGHIENVNTSRF